MNIVEHGTICCSEALYSTIIYRELRRFKPAKVARVCAARNAHAHNLITRTTPAVVVNAHERQHHFGKLTRCPHKRFSALV